MIINWLMTSCWEPSQSASSYDCYTSLPLSQPNQRLRGLLCLMAPRKF